MIDDVGSLEFLKDLYGKREGEGVSMERLSIRLANLDKN